MQEKSTTHPFIQLVIDLTDVPFIHSFIQLSIHWMPSMYQALCEAFNIIKKKKDSVPAFEEHTV